jgi:hypothetical protein
MNEIVYEGEIVIPDFECPARYSVIMSTDKDLVISELNKIEEFFKSLPELKDRFNLFYLNLRDNNLDIIERYYEAKDFFESYSNNIIITNIKEHKLNSNSLSHLFKVNTTLIDTVGNTSDELKLRIISENEKII